MNNHPPSKILLVIINDLPTQTKLTNDLLYQAFIQHGSVKKILIFSRGLKDKAFVEFMQLESVITAKSQLIGHSLVPKGGRLQIFFSKLEELDFSQYQNTQGCDYTQKTKDDFFHSLSSEQKSPLQINDGEKDYFKYSKSDDPKFLMKQLQNFQLKSDEEEDEIVMPASRKQITNDGPQPDKKNQEVPRNEEIDNLLNDTDEEEQEKNNAEERKSCEASQVEAPQITKQEQPQVQVQPKTDTKDLQNQLTLQTQKKTTTAVQKLISNKSRSTILSQKQAEVCQINKEVLPFLKNTEVLKILFEIPSNILYIQGLRNETLNTQKLYNLLSNFGNIVRILFLKEKHLAFIEFSSIEYGVICKELLMNTSFFGNYLKIKYKTQDMLERASQQKHQLLTTVSSQLRFKKDKPISINCPTETLHASNLRNPNSKQLTQLFEKCGSVSAFKGLKMFGKQNDNTMAFIQMSKLDESLEAMATLHNYDINGKKMVLSFTGSKIDEKK